MTVLSEQGTGLGEFAEAFVAGTDQELAKLDKQRLELEHELRSVKEQARRIRSVLTALLPKEPKPTAEKKVNGKAFAPSAERLDEFTTWLASLDDSVEITSATLRVGFPGWAGSYISMMMKWARENGYLRKSGQSGQTSLYRKLG